MILARIGALLPRGVAALTRADIGLSGSWLAGVDGVGGMIVDARGLHSSAVSAKFLKPTSDIAFKRLFGDERNKDITIDFLNSLLEIEGSKKIKEIVHLNVEKTPELLEGKKTYLDILCKDEKGEFFIVEMQRRFEPDFEERAQFYVAREVSNQLRIGAPYADSRPVYFIGILEHKFYETEEGITIFDITNRAHHDHKMKLMKWMFVELPKISSSSLKGHAEAINWLKLLKEADRLEAIPDDIDSPVLKKAYEALDERNFTRAERDETKWIEDEELRFSANLERARVEAEQALERENQALEREKQALEEKQQALEEKQQALEEKQQALEEKQQALEKLVQIKKQAFISLSKMKGVEEAARSLGLSEEDVAAFNIIDMSSVSSTVKGQVGSFKGTRHFSTFTLAKEIADIYEEDGGETTLDSYQIPVIGDNHPQELA